MVRFKVNPHVSAKNTHAGIKKFSLFYHKGALYRDLTRDLSGSALTNTNWPIPWNPRGVKRKWLAGWQGSPITSPKYMTKATATPKLTHQPPPEQMLFWELCLDAAAYGLCTAIWRARDGQKQSGESGKLRMTCQFLAYVSSLADRLCLDASLALRWRKILTQRKTWCNCICSNAVSGD